MQNIYLLGPCLLDLVSANSTQEVQWIPVSVFIAAQISAVNYDSMMSNQQTKFIKVSATEYYLYTPKVLFQHKHAHWIRTYIQNVRTFVTGKLVQKPNNCQYANILGIGAGGGGGGGGCFGESDQ